METFDNESFLLENYRAMPSSRIAYFGNHFKCWRIERLTKSIIYKKSWIDSSSESDTPPDFYNKKHKIMMEFMRVDDCINERVDNSFKKASLFLKKHFGYDYKTKYNISMYFTADTSDSELFNFSGYISSFERIVLNHSKKVVNYRSNHPECKDLVFFISDESNNYVQVSNKNDLLNKNKKNAQLNNAIVHGWYHDKQFLDILKKCGADYVIWVGWYKLVFVNGKEVKQPKICIYDIKNLNNCGVEYNHDLMLKVTEEEKIH